MDGQKKEVETKLRVETAQLDKLAESMRRNGRPQSIKTLTRYYIELLKESAGVK